MFSPSVGQAHGHRLCVRISPPTSYRICLNMIAFFHEPANLTRASVLIIPPSVARLRWKVPAQK
ncbi:hypothetical protein KCP73_24625 [Salmonella enterica subsp. enterica]|nr:hypothetical protein KCP73_24625 [Salmonella enterica subsp. enterica]